MQLLLLLQLFYGSLYFVWDNPGEPVLHWHTLTQPFYVPLGFCPDYPGKTKLDLLEQVSGSGISWAICKSAPGTLTQTQPHQHPTTVFLQAGCPSCHPINSVKALSRKYSPTHTYSGDQSQSSLSASFICYDPWHPPYSIYVPDRFMHNLYMQLSSDAM